MGLRGQKGGSESEGIGRSKGGLTSKVVALTDAVGHLIRFVVLPGQTHDLKAVPELLDDLTCETLIGDKAFDADGVLDTLTEREMTAVIPPRSNRSTPRDFDRDADKERHRIENVFAKIKEAQSLATRYDKTRASFAAGIDLMAGVVAARSLSTGLRKINEDAVGYEQEWVKSSTTIDAFGVGFSHDLGGGATLKAGAGSVDSNAVADLGITMKF